MERTLRPVTRAPSVLVACLLVSLLAACARPAPSAPTASAPTGGAPAATDAAGLPALDTAKVDAIRVAWTAASGSQTPLWIAYEGGYFQKYGLDVDLSFVASSSTAVQAVLADEIQFSACAGDNDTRKFGTTRDSPDEIQVRSRPPLSVPPLLTQRPPRPGRAGKPAED